ncbi:MAG: hypothetical protein EBX50_18730 [Chitinophagia bacterium]|nr:hypothetical protein [Chitinophagia bacterium]
MNSIQQLIRDLDISINSVRTAFQNLRTAFDQLPPEIQYFIEPQNLNEVLSKEQKESLSIVHTTNRIIGRKVLVYPSPQQHDILLAWGVLQSVSEHITKPSAIIDIKWINMSAIQTVSANPGYIKNLRYAYINRCVLVPFSN